MSISRLKGKFDIAVFVLGLLLMGGCGLPTPSGRIGLWGVSGYYQQGKLALTGLHRDINKGVVLLEEAARRDPLYEDVLTLLGRGYYAQGRYKGALEVLKRALAVNGDDEIAWVFLGLTQLRRGEDAAGLESLKGGLTLLIRHSKSGYRGHDNWDADGDVRRSISRAIFTVRKVGLDNRRRLISAVERMILRLDEEDFRRELTRGDEWTQ